MKCTVPPIQGTYLSLNVTTAAAMILSGTPGRVYDMISRRALKLDDVKLFVLDEADEMLSRGFKEQIYDGKLVTHYTVCMYGCMYGCMSVVSE